MNGTADVSAQTIRKTKRSANPVDLKDLDIRLSGKRRLKGDWLTGLLRPHKGNHNK